MSAAGAASARPWPVEIRLRKSDRRIDIAFDDGSQFHLPAEYLRVESPSAEVQGHGGGEKKIVPGKRMVALTGIESVGNYAVRLLFDDGHDTGLYTWDYLYELGRDRNARWADYQAALAARSLSRE